MTDTEKKHFFNFSYYGGSLESGNPCHASVIVGYDSKNINENMINENMEYAGVRDDAVLISVSYLGYMAKEEVMG